MSLAPMIIISLSPCKCGLIQTSITDHFSVSNSIPVVDKNQSINFIHAQLNTIKYRDISEADYAAQRQASVGLISSMIEMELKYLMI